MSLSSRLAYSLVFFYGFSTQIFVLSAYKRGELGILGKLVEWIYKGSETFLPNYYYIGHFINLDQENKCVIIIYKHYIITIYTWSHYFIPL